MTRKIWALKPLESHNMEFKSNWRDDAGGELWNMSRKVNHA